MAVKRPTCGYLHRPPRTKTCRGTKREPVDLPARQTPKHIPISHVSTSAAENSQTATLKSRSTRGIIMDVGMFALVPEESISYFTGRSLLTATHRDGLILQNKQHVICALFTLYQITQDITLITPASYGFI